MDETLPWYRAMPPENRSWIGLVAQAGIAAFTEWFRHPDAPQAISTDVFGTAPRELTRAITLRQTVEMVRTTIEVMESAIDEVAAPGRRGGAARGAARLRPGDRLRHRPGVRAGRRGTRRLGRPAGVAGGQRGAVRRGRRGRACPGPPRSAGTRPSMCAWCWAPPPTATAS